MIKAKSYFARLLNPHILLPVSLFIVLGGIIMSQPQKEKPITPGSVYRLSSSEIEALAPEAMSGNEEAAQKLAHHYEFTPNENGYEIAVEWTMIGAESGHVISQWNTAYDMIYATDEPSTRAVFWMRLAANNGSESAIRELNYYEISINFDLLPDSSFPSSYKDISVEKIKTYEDGALQGNGKAALLLANYYSNTVKDANLATYWYRIGAQNGNVECQYQLGLILSQSENVLEKTRGIFWQKKAEQNDHQ